MLSALHMWPCVKHLGRVLLKCSDFGFQCNCNVMIGRKFHNRHADNHIVMMDLVRFYTIIKT